MEVLYTCCTARCQASTRLWQEGVCVSLHRIAKGPIAAPGLPTSGIQNSWLSPGKIFSRFFVFQNILGHSHTKDASVASWHWFLNPSRNCRSSQCHWSLLEKQDLTRKHWELCTVSSAELAESRIVTFLSNLWGLRRAQWGLDPKGRSPASTSNKHNKAWLNWLPCLKGTSGKHIAVLDRLWFTNPLLCTSQRKLCRWIKKPKCAKHLLDADDSGMKTAHCFLAWHDGGPHSVPGKRRRILNAMFGRFVNSKFSLFCWQPFCKITCTDPLLTESDILDSASWCGNTGLKFSSETWPKRHACQRCKMLDTSSVINCYSASGQMLNKGNINTCFKWREKTRGNSQICASKTVTHADYTPETLWSTHMQNLFASFTMQMWKPMYEILLFCCHHREDTQTQQRHTHTHAHTHIHAHNSLISLTETETEFILDNFCQNEHQRRKPTKTPQRNFEVINDWCQCVRRESPGWGRSSTLSHYFSNRKGNCHHEYSTVHTWVPMIHFLFVARVRKESTGQKQGVVDQILPVVSWDTLFSKKQTLKCSGKTILWLHNSNDHARSTAQESSGEQSVELRKMTRFYSSQASMVDVRFCISPFCSFGSAVSSPGCFMNTHIWKWDLFCVFFCASWGKACQLYSAMQIAPKVALVYSAPQTSAIHFGDDTRKVNCTQSHCWVIAKVFWELVSLPSFVLF